MNESALATQDAWKTKALIIGAVLGLATGLGAAYLLTQRSDPDGSSPEFSAGNGLKLSLLLLGLIRQIVQLFE